MKQPRSVERGAALEAEPATAADIGEWSLRSTRRDLLRGSLGAAILLAGPRVLRDAFSPSVAMAAPATGSMPYFVFGTPDPSNADDPSFLAGEGASTTLLAHRLAAPPLRSIDRSRLALVSIDEVAGSAGVTVTVVDTGSASVTATGTLTLSDAPDALVLVTPALSLDAATVCLAISITTPTDWRDLPKLNPLTGNTETRRVATWVSSHEIAYFDTRSKSFAGPFPLNDAPALASVNVVATATDFYLWTMAEPAAVRGTKANRTPAPIPDLSAYPFGSGSRRFTQPAPATWPVNGEPVAALTNGNLVRLVSGSILETYSATDGTSNSQSLRDFAALTTPRPARTRMDQRPDGSLFISNPGLGRAVLLDGRNPSTVRASVAHDRRASLAGSRLPQTQLSEDGKAFYALGPSGGIVSYSASSGQRTAAVADDMQFTGLYRLSSGGLAATSFASPKLTFFDDSLTQVGVADTNFYIDGVY